MNSYRYEENPLITPAYVKPFHGIDLVELRTDSGWLELYHGATKEHR